jgi:chromosome segregation ATPase
MTVPSDPKDYKILSQRGTINVQSGHIKRLQARVADLEGEIAAAIDLMATYYDHHDTAHPACETPVTSTDVRRCVESKVALEARLSVAQERAEKAEKAATKWMDDWYHAQAETAAVRTNLVAAQERAEGMEERLNYELDKGLHRHDDLAAQLAAANGRIAALEAEITNIRSMAPYVEASGHYCDGMSEAWSDAQDAIDKQVEAEGKVAALEASNADLVADRDRLEETVSVMLAALETVAQNVGGQMSNEGIRRVAEAAILPTANRWHSPEEWARLQGDLERARTVLRETNEARENLLTGNREFQGQLATVRAELEKHQTCPSCGGTGWFIQPYTGLPPYEEDHEGVPCGKCGGSRKDPDVVAALSSSGSAAGEVIRCAVALEPHLGGLTGIPWELVAAFKNAVAALKGEKGGKDAD